MGGLVGTQNGGPAVAENGANINEKSRDELTALELAVKRGYATVVHLSLRF